MLGILLRPRAFPDDSVLTQSLFLQASHTCDSWLNVTQQYLAETAKTEKSPIDSLELQSVARGRRSLEGRLPPTSTAAE